MYDGFLVHSPLEAQYEQYLLLSWQFGIGGVGMVVVVVVVTAKMKMKHFRNQLKAKTRCTQRLCLMGTTYNCYCISM